MWLMGVAHMLTSASAIHHKVDSCINCQPPCGQALTIGCLVRCYTMLTGPQLCCERVFNSQALSTRGLCQLNRALQFLASHSHPRDQQSTTSLLMAFQSEYAGWQQGAFIPPVNTIAPHGQQLQESIEEAVQRTVAGAIPHIVDQLHDRNPPNTAGAIEEAVQRAVEGTIPHLVDRIRRETAELRKSRG